MCVVCTTVYVGSFVLFTASILLCFLLSALFYPSSGLVAMFMLSAGGFLSSFRFCGCAYLGGCGVCDTWCQLDLLFRTGGRMWGRLRVGCLGLLGLDVRPSCFWFV